MRDRVTGEKKQSQEATSIIDPATEKEVTKVDDIKAVSLKYCTDLLTNRPPRPGYEDDIACKVMLHEVRMLESENDTEIALTHYTCESSLKELSVKNPTNIPLFCVLDQILKMRCSICMKKYGILKINLNNGVKRKLYSCTKEKVILKC